MKVLLLILALSISVQAKGLFEFKKYTLNTFNEARRLLAAGSLKTIADIINKAVPKAVPDFGPASNMYKLKWSAKLEHKAYLYGKGKSPLPDITLDSFKYKGLVGFQWPGLITEIVEKVLGYVLPWDALKDAIMSFVNLFEGILMALLIVKNFPPENGLVTENDNLGATEILFAHRYEIGCYTKVVYSICFMEPSRNGGRMFKKGVPCSECPTHCEFFEDDNGFIEEGDMCVPPREESNTTAALVVKQEQYVVANASMIPTPLIGSGDDAMKYWGDVGEINGDVLTMITGTTDWLNKMKVSKDAKLADFSSLFAGLSQLNDLNLKTDDRLLALQLLSENAGSLLDSTIPYSHAANIE